MFWRDLLNMYFDTILWRIDNSNNKYLYSASLCITQNAVTQNKWYTINKGKEMLEFEMKHAIR